MDKKVKSIYNSILEVSLRILIILANTEEPKSVEEIAVIDFMSVYGHEFDIYDCNLHGDNYYMYGESAARLEKTRKALEELILRNMVEIIPDKFGFRYAATVPGRVFSKTLNSSFALDYEKCSNLAEEKVTTKGLPFVQKLITAKAKQSIEESN